LRFDVSVTIIQNSSIDMGKSTTHAVDELDTFSLEEELTGRIQFGVLVPGIVSLPPVLQTSIAVKALYPALITCQELSISCVFSRKRKYYDQLQRDIFTFDQPSSRKVTSQILPGLIFTTCYENIVGKEGIYLHIIHLRGVISIRRICNPYKPNFTNSSYQRKRNQQQQIVQSLRQVQIRGRIFAWHQTISCLDCCMKVSCWSHDLFQL